MANICCDDVIFYTEGNPEGLYDLWEDLETYIILNQNPDLCWIGNLLSGDSRCISCSLCDAKHRTWRTNLL